MESLEKCQLKIQAIKKSIERLTILILATEDSRKIVLK